MLYRVLFLFLLVLFIGVFLLSQRNKFYLERIEVSTADSISIIEKIENKSIDIVGISTSKAFGRFDYFIAIIKHMPDGRNIVFKVDAKKNGIRVSDRLVAIVKPYGKTNYGWFYVKDGEIMNKLPGLEKIVDSIKRVYSENVFINESNGYLSLNQNGKNITSFNYGNFISKYRNVSFDSLDYKLYKLVADSLINISEEGDELFKQRNGVFFLPSPGYGVIKKFDKEKVLNIVDSISTLKSPPRKVLL